MTLENSFLRSISGSSGEYLTTKCGCVVNELISDTFLHKVKSSSGIFYCQLRLVVLIGLSGVVIVHL